MKYRLRKVIDRHYPKDDYSNFELVEGGEQDCRKPFYKKRHPLGRMKLHTQQTLSQEFRRHTATPLFAPAPQALLDWLEDESRDQESEEEEEVLCLDNPVNTEHYQATQEGVHEREKQVGEAQRVEVKQGGKAEITHASADTDDGFFGDDFSEPTDRGTGELKAAGELTPKVELGHTSNGDSESDSDFEANVIKRDDESATEIARHLVEDTLSTASETVKSETTEKEIDTNTEKQELSKRQTNYKEERTKDKQQTTNEGKSQEKLQEKSQEKSEEKAQVKSQEKPHKNALEKSQEKAQEGSQEKPQVNPKEKSQEKTQEKAQDKPKMNPKEKAQEKSQEKPKVNLKEKSQEKTKEKAQVDPSEKSDPEKNPEKECTGHTVSIPYPDKESTTEEDTSTERMSTQDIKSIIVKKKEKSVSFSKSKSK